jgi:hypothetical protein
VTPCDKWNTSHKCYRCACAQAAEGQGCNKIALALQDAGIDCTVEQTGGFCMVVYIWADDQSSWIGLTQEGMGWTLGNWNECEYLESVEFPCSFMPDHYPPEGMGKEHLDEIVRVIKENLWRVGK